MDRFEKLDLSSSLRPILLPNENIIVVQDKVGLYNGKLKVDNHQEGVVYLTTHRILYVDTAKPRLNSVGLSLTLVKETEIYPGFLRSSPKITLFLHSKPNPTASNSSSHPTSTSSISSTPTSLTWICPICSFSNTATFTKCKLCGVHKPESAKLVSPSSPQVSVLAASPLVTNPSPLQPPSLEDQISTGLPCPICTFVNHPSMVRCEMCEAELPGAGGPIVEGTARMNSLGMDEEGELVPRPMTPDMAGLTLDDERPDYLKLAFRNGGYSNFGTVLKNTLIAKAWEKNTEATSSSSKVLSSTTPRGFGIGGIEEKINKTQSETKETLKDAFKDLDGLMALAAPMVKLAESITAKLSKEPAGGETTSEDDATSFRTYLLNLGIASPVTRDSAGAIYHKELARELAEFLSNVLDRKGGMMSLADVYCIFNRARGIALISPEDLYKACSLFEQLDLPMRLRRFDSGLLVIQSLSHTDDRVARRIVEHVQTRGPLTAIKVAELESVPLPLALEQLLVTEKQGFICRDESVAGLTFYENLIKDYRWDPPVF